MVVKVKNQTDTERWRAAVFGRESYTPISWSYTHIHTQPIYVPGLVTTYLNIM